MCKLTVVTRRLLSPLHDCFSSELMVSDIFECDLCSALANVANSQLTQVEAI